MVIDFLASWGLGYAMTKGVDALLKKELQHKLNKAIAEWAKQYEEEAYVKPEVFYSDNQDISDAPNYEKLKSLLSTKDSEVLDEELWCNAFMEQWHYIRRKKVYKPEDWQPFFNLPENEAKTAFEKLSASIVKICNEDDPVFKDNSRKTQNKIDGKCDEILAKLKKKDGVLAFLKEKNDGSSEANEAITSFAVDGEFGLARKYLSSKMSSPQNTDIFDEVIIKREQELQEIIKAGIFYEGTKKLDELIAKNVPTSVDLGELVQIINSDNDLAIYFYRENTNPGWLDKLNTAGQFKQLEDAKLANDLLTRMKAFYLVEVSNKEPKEVVDLISGLYVKDWFIQGILLQALLAKPLDVVDEGCELIKKYFDNPSYTDWYGQGECSAEFMVKIAVDYPDKAFEIAKLLLKIEQANDENKYSDRTKTHFKDYDYEELLFKYCKKLWQLYPFDATKLLIDVFNNYLNELENDDFDSENGFHYTVERLDQIESGYSERSLRNIIQGICESGKEVIENEPEKIDDLFSYLEKLDSPIFERIEMYLLRFVPGDGQIDRVNSIISDKKFLTDLYSSIYSYEYKLLLRDRFENISPNAKRIFIDWIKEKQVPDDDLGNFADWFKKFNERDYTNDDLLKYEDKLRAGKLYLVKDKGEFKDLYEKYRDSSGKSDEELAPEPRMSEARWISGKEGAPANSNEMFEMEPVEAIKYINDPARWIIDKTNEWPSRSPKEALSQVFEDVVKEKVDDYVALELEELQKLEPVFLERYFNGIVNVFREKDLQEDSLLKVLNNSKSIVDANFDSSDHNWTFRLILEIIETIFNRDELKKSIVPENGRLVWYIIDKLRTYKDNRKSDSKSDADTECINSVSGKAFTLVVTFGLFFKNQHKEDYCTNWSEKIKHSIEDVIDKDQRRWVRCVLGVNFPQIHWLEKEFTEANIDNIFDVNDDETWKDVWGQYLSWGRTYQNIFEFLRGRGKYSDAIDKIGMYGQSRGFAEGAGEGLVQHLMIAYFNSWIEWSDPLLNKFFTKAPVELRAKAASFLRTGFKPTLEKKSEDPTDFEEKAERIRVYWKKRIEEIEPENDIEEAIRLIGWVEDSLLDAKETLELTLATLDLTGGKLSQHRGEGILVKAACKLGINNELLALKCINKMMAGKPEWLHFSLYQEELKKFLDRVIELAKIDSKIKDEAIELINAYGRRNINDLRRYYDRLVESS